MRTLLIFLLSISVFSQTIYVRDSSPALRVTDWTVGSNSTITFSADHGLSVNQSVVCSGFQSQPNLNGDFLVASIPATNQIILKTFAGDPIPTFNQKQAGYNYSQDQDLQPNYKAWCGPTFATELNGNGLLPAIGSAERTWITDPDGPGPLSAPAMSGELGEWVTRNANTFSSAVCNPNLPIGSGNCYTESTWADGVTFGDRFATVALAAFMNQQNTRWVNSAKAFIKNIEILTPVSGNFFTATDPIAIHGNRGEDPDFAKLRQTFWGAIGYPLIKWALTPEERETAFKKFWNDDDDGCEPILPPVAGEVSSSGGQLALNDATGWVVGSRGYVRHTQKNFKVSDGSLTGIVVSGTTATATLNGANHNTGQWVKISGSGNSTLDGHYIGTGTSEVTFAVSSEVPDGTYAGSSLELYSYGTINTGNQGTLFRVTNVVGNTITTTPAITSAFNSPYAKVRDWNENTCGLQWFIMRHDGSVPLDQKSYIRVVTPIQQSDMTISVQPAYAGVMRHWVDKGPFTVTIGKEQMLASGVSVPDDSVSPAVITLSERGYNRTPVMPHTVASTAVYVTKNGRVSGEAGAQNQMWQSSIFQNLRITHLGGVISNASATGDESTKGREYFRRYYNVYRDQHLDFAKRHWSGNTPATTNPGYQIGRQQNQMLSAALSTSNSVTDGASEVENTWRGRWLNDLNLWPIHVTMPYNPRRRFVISDGGQDRFIEMRQVFPGFMNFMAPGQEFRWGNFFNKRVSKQAMDYSGTANRNLALNVIYNSLSSPEEDFRVSHKRGHVFLPVNPESREKGFGLNMITSITDWNNKSAAKWWMYAFRNGDHTGSSNPSGSYQMALNTEGICTGTIYCLSSLNQSGMRVFTVESMPQVTVGSTSSKDITIFLAEPAPSGGAMIELESDNFVVQVPRRVTVPQGQMSLVVPAMNHNQSPRQFALITATSANTRTAYLNTLNQTTSALGNASIASISFDQGSVVRGNFTTGTITLTGPASGTINIALTASAGILVPSQVRVRAGQSVTRFFVAGGAATTGTVTATAANSVVSPTFTVTAASPGSANIVFIQTTADSITGNNSVRPWQSGGESNVIPKYGIGSDYSFWQLIGQQNRLYGAYNDNSLNYYQRSFFHVNEFGSQDYAIIHNVYTGVTETDQPPGRELVERIAFYRGSSNDGDVVMSTTQTRDGANVTFIKADTSPTHAGGLALTTKFLLPLDADKRIIDNFTTMNPSTSWGSFVHLYMGNGRDTRESMWVHKATPGSSITQPNATLIGTIDSNSSGVLINENPSWVVTFPKNSTPLTGTSFTVNPTSAGHVRLTGFAGGTYTITRNGSAHTTACVKEPDSVLGFSLPPGNGAFVVSQTASAPCSPPLWWVTKSLPEQIESTAFTMNLTTEDGSGAKTFSLASGSLPTGVSMNSSGVISGATSAIGSYPITVNATDSVATVPQNFTLVIASGAGALTITTATLPGGFQGTAYSASVVGSGGVVPYKFSIIDGTLPDGLNMNAAGVISGTPTTSGVFEFTVELEDDTTLTVEKTFTIIILEPTGELSITTESIPNGTVGTPLSFQLAALGGTPSYTWSILSGTLPDGINLSSSGLLSGTPTEDGVFNVTYRVTDANSVQAQKALSLTIEDTPPTPIGNIDVSVKAAGTVGLVTFRKAGLDANQSCTVEVFNNLNQLVDSAISASGLAVRTVAISSLVALQVFRAEVTCGDDNGYSVFSPEQVSGTRDFTLEFKPEAGISSVTVEWGPPGNMSNSTTQSCSGGCTVTLTDINRGTILDIRYTLAAPSSIRKVLVR